MPPPSLLWDSVGGRDPTVRVRLGSTAGSGWHCLPKALSASWHFPELTACLLRRKAASYLGLSPCQLSCFLSLFLLQPQANR